MLSTEKKLFMMKFINNFFRFIKFCRQSYLFFRDEDDLFEDMEMTEGLVKEGEDLIAQVLKV